MVQRWGNDIEQRQPTRWGLLDLVKPEDPDAYREISEVPSGESRVEFVAAPKPKRVKCLARG